MELSINGRKSAKTFAKWKQATKLPTRKRLRKKFLKNIERWYQRYCFRLGGLGNYFAGVYGPTIDEMLSYKDPLLEMLKKEDGAEWGGANIPFPFKE